MQTAILIAVVFVGIAVALRMYRELRARRIANDRLLVGIAAPGFDDEESTDVPAIPRRFARRHYVLPWLAAAPLFAVLKFAVGWPWIFSAALAVLAGLVLVQVDATLLTWATSRIEIQLADAIDLIVSALKVGAALQTALENVLREVRSPLRPQLDEVVARIRLGETPRVAFASLAERVPLETFQLFSTALAVHWDVGGSLAPTLSTVGRTIRDRIEIARRLRGLTTQARTSVIAIILTTCFIAALMWRNSPERMNAFLATDFGRWSVATAIVLDGIGIVWISRMSKGEF
jgi:tight adherence protein B